MLNKSWSLLIIDDSVTARRAMKRIIEQSELKPSFIYEARDGAEGLAKLHELWIDLVLLDLGMPVMTGAELIAAMVADPLLCDIPVIVVSAECNHAVLGALALKGVIYVPKPIQASLLRQVVEKVLYSRI